MGFQSATLQFSRNGDAAVAEWRQDLAVNDVVTVSLTDNVGVNSYIWRLVGRPEGSAAGGPGPEPRYLGTAQVASFTVDALGTYIIQCLVNGGAPDALAIGGGVAILESFLAPGNRSLRLLGPGESNEDVYDPMVVQGWIKMLNRWLTKIRAGGGTTDTFKVMSDGADDSPDYLIGKVESTDGSVTITDDVAGKRVNFAVLAKPAPNLTKRYYLTGQGSDLARADPGDPQTGYLLSLTNPSDEAHALDVGHPGASPLYLWFDSPPGEPGLASWPSGIVTGNLRVRVRNAHGGMTYKLYPGDNSIAYEAMLYDVMGGLFYQSTPWPSAPVLSSSYQTFQLPLYVTGLSGSSSRRLRADLILQVSGGSITDEVFEVRCGGDNASWFDTLFTPSGNPTGASDHKVSVDAGDIADYLFAKLSAGTNITLTKAGSEPHETVRIDASGGGTSNSVESTDGSITVTNVGGGVQNIELPNSTAIPTIDGGAGSAGPAGPKANELHQHPAGPVAAVTSTLYAVPDNAGNFTIMPPTGEGSSYLNVGSLTSVYPASGSFVQAAFEPNVTTFYVRADGTLGTTPPSGSGFLSQTFTSVGGGGEGTGGSGATIAFGNAGYPNLVSWPGGTAPVTIYARIASLPGGYDGSPFPLTLVLFRSDASNVEDTIAEYGTLINVANLPTNGSWAALNVSVPVTAIPGGNASDILGYFVEVTSGNASAGAVLEVAYGGSQMSSITLPFPPPGADYWAGMARLPFISLANVPGLLTWNAGNVGVLVNCQMSGAIAGHVYEFEVQLLRVTGAASSVIYQGNGSFCTPGEPVTSSPQVFTFNVPVQALAGLTTDQLVLDIIGTSDVGGVPAPATVFFRVNTGGADPTQATQIQTLFVPGGGSGAIGDHQLLTNRGTFLVPGDSTTFAHPMSDIEPGWVQTPTTAVAVVGGLLPLASASPTPVMSNAVDVTGAGPLVGIEKTGKNSGDSLELFWPNGSMTITNQGSPGDPNYAAIAFGTLGQGYPSPDVTINQYGVLRLTLRGGVWRPACPWFSPETT